MAKSCSLCQKDVKTRKATLNLLTSNGWELTTLDLCDFCIEDEEATVKPKVKRKVKAKAAKGKAA